MGGLISRFQEENSSSIIGDCEISRRPVDSCSRSSCRSPGPGHVSPHLSLYRSSSPLSMCGLQEEDPELDTRLVSATLQQPVCPHFTLGALRRCKDRALSSSIVNICNTFLLLTAFSLFLSFLLPLHLRHQQSI